MDTQSNRLNPHRPRSSRKHWHRFLWGLSVLGLAWVGPLSAQPDSAPGAGQALPEEGAVTLEVDEAVVLVTLEPQAAARVSAVRRVEGADLPVTLAVTSDGQGGTVVRAGEIQPGLTVSLRIDPARFLRIEGAGLELTVDDLRRRSTQLPDPKKLPSAGLELSLFQSVARLNGVRHVQVLADQSDLAFQASGGAVTVDLRGGRATLTGHRGLLTWIAEGSEGEVSDLVGQVALELTGGGLTLREMVAQVQGRMGDAQLDVESLEGSLALSGDRSTILARRLSTSFLTVRGRDLQTEISSTGSPLTLRQQQGTLTLTDYHGEARIELLEGAQAEANGGSGSLLLTLRQEALAVARDFDGMVRADMNDSAVEVEGAARMAANATRSRITARRIGSVNRIRATDGDLELDFTGVAKVAPMELKGSSRANIAMTAPCVVRLTAAAGLPGEAADVLGCDLETPDAPRRVHAKKRFGGQAAILQVEVGPEAELRVEGQ